MINKIYIVVVQPKVYGAAAGVSGEGYKTLEEAIGFIFSRSDNPSLYRDWVYEGDDSIYFIKDVYIKKKEV